MKHTVDDLPSFKFVRRSSISHRPAIERVENGTLGDWFKREDVKELIDSLSYDNEKDYLELFDMISSPPVKRLAISLLPAAVIGLAIFAGLSKRYKR